jgi:Uma2 family endonuclease
MSFNQPPATLDDLIKVEGKAELIGGRIVTLMPTGELPSEVGFLIAMALHDHARATGKGRAYPCCVGFAVPVLASGRESFCPDASYYVGPLSGNRMRFIQGPPTLAVEVRDCEEYGRFAEAEMEAKRADYFEAGTLVVWDVDPIARVVRMFTANQPDQPIVFSAGENADAEPAVPGWRMPVDAMFT